MPQPPEGDPLNAAQPTPLAVIWIGGVWCILRNGRRWGRFDYQVDAVEAAIRLARQPGESNPVEVLVHDRWGGLAPLRVA